MASDENVTGPGAQGEEPWVEPVLVDTLQTSMTALASAEADTLSARQSAIGSANVGGDAEVSASAVGMLSAKGDAAMKMAGAGAVLAEKSATVTQGGAFVVIGDKVKLDRSVGGTIVASEVETRNSNVILLLSRKTTMSEGSRVLFDWKAALILAAVLAGFVGIAAVLGFLLVRRGVRAAKHFSVRLPHLPDLPHLPELPDWVHTLDRWRRSA